jgi:glycosyltransferase involved in cell wall biosynthesis
MKIGIDLTSLLYHRGVSRYTKNLFKALSQETNLELYPYAASGRGYNELYRVLVDLQHSLPVEKQAAFQNNLQLQRVPSKLNWFYWHYLHLNQIRKLMPEIDVFHSWDYLQPPDTNLPLVSTIHDLTIFKYPYLANTEILIHHRESIKILRKRRAHIIAVSKHTQADAIKVLGFDPDHVHLVYEALPTETLLPARELTRTNFIKLRQKYTLNRKYVLFVGTREPRKNLVRLIEAWWPLKERLDLVLVGAKGWAEPKLTHPNIKILQGVSDYDLGLLYYFAQMLTYPSLEEGFGLPILEAFAYKTPVVTSFGTATEEIAGKAGVLVNPHSVNEINEGIRKILGENKKERLIRQKKMAKQLDKFSWKRAALATKKVYELARKDFAHA